MKNITDNLVDNLDWEKINRLWRILELDKSTGIVDLELLKIELKRRFDIFVASGKLTGQYLNWWFFRISKPKIFSKYVGEQYEIHFTPIRGVEFEKETTYTDEELFELGVTFDLPKKSEYDIETTILMKKQSELAQKGEYERANVIKEIIINDK